MSSEGANNTSTTHKKEMWLNTQLSKWMCGARFFPQFSLKKQKGVVEKIGRGEEEKRMIES